MHLSMQNKTRIAFLLIAFVGFIAIGNAIKNRDSSLRFVAKDDVAYVYGTSDSFSYETTRKFLSEYPNVDTLILHRMPGTIDGDTNTKIARAIREAGLNTHLLSNSMIASGAVDLFIAGNERTMECGGLIGVHSWSYGKGIGPKAMGGDLRQKFHETFLRDMGIDPEFYTFTRDSADPNDMHYMTSEEIKRFGLLTQSADCE